MTRAQEVRLPKRTNEGVWGAHVYVLILVALAFSACGGSVPLPEPGTSFGLPPDMRGTRVMVLPVQQVLGVQGDPDAELAFGLGDRTREVAWVLSQEVDDALARSPSVDATTRGLSVGHFLRSEVQRIGDPLFGEFRRMAALVNADGVLLPVQASLVADAAGGAKVQLAVAIIQVRTGRVAWFGIVEGGAFPAGDPRGLASAVDVLARTLLWYADG